MTATETTISQIANLLELTVNQFETLLGYLQSAINEIVVTPAGNIEMPPSLESDFESIVAGLAKTSNTLSTNFKTLASDVSDIEKSVIAAGENSDLPIALFFNCILNICNQAMSSFSEIGAAVTAIDSSFTNLGSIIQKGTNQTTVEVSIRNLSLIGNLFIGD